MRKDYQERKAKEMRKKMEKQERKNRNNRRRVKGFWAIAEAMEREAA